MGVTVELGVIHRLESVAVVSRNPQTAVDSVHRRTLGMFPRDQLRLWTGATRCGRSRKDRTVGFATTSQSSGDCLSAGDFAFSGGADSLFTGERNMSHGMSFPSRSEVLSHESGEIL